MSSWDVSFADVDSDAFFYWIVTGTDGFRHMIWCIGLDKNGVFWLKSTGGESRRDYSDWPDLVDAIETLMDVLRLTAADVDVIEQRSLA
jgi:hypothetical protein